RRVESPSAADILHLHQRELEIGHYERRAVLLIYRWAGILAFGAVSVTLFDGGAVYWIVGLALLLAVGVSVIPRLRSRNQGVPR
ncbi:undecaprenyl-phosphate alpha-N-acetylglucosaminyl 1-phosphate transferase, partial [Amycolatopsis sp. H20-H5]|nr:undecaprenyl-phosphate alpha-N-acetylglucosaminyl 1-phosphate transferase [Amycolatopsis sp. H20-H5]